MTIPITCSVTAPYTISTIGATDSSLNNALNQTIDRQVPSCSPYCIACAVKIFSNPIWLTAAPEATIAAALWDIVEFSSWTYESAPDLPSI